MCLYLVQMNNGIFTDNLYFFSWDEYEYCWLPSPEGGSLFDSVATAEKEMKANYPWIRDVKFEKPPGNQKH